MGSRPRAWIMSRRHLPAIIQSCAPSQRFKCQVKLALWLACPTEPRATPSSLPFPRRFHAATAKWGVGLRDLVAAMLLVWRRHVVWRRCMDSLILELTSASIPWSSLPRRHFCRRLVIFPGFCRQRRSRNGPPIAHLDPCLKPPRLGTNRGVGLHEQIRVLRSGPGPYNVMGAEAAQQVF